MMDKVLSTKETREGVLGARRATMSGEFNLTDPSRDVSESLLASFQASTRLNRPCTGMDSSQTLRGPDHDAPHARRLLPL